LRYGDHRPALLHAERARTPAFDREHTSKATVASRKPFAFALYVSAARPLTSLVGSVSSFGQMEGRSSGDHRGMGSHTRGPTRLLCLGAVLDCARVEGGVPQTAPTPCAPTASEKNRPAAKARRSLFQASAQRRHHRGASHEHEPRDDLRRAQRITLTHPTERRTRAFVIVSISARSGCSTGRISSLPPRSDSSTMLVALRHARLDFACPRRLGAATAFASPDRSAGSALPTIQATRAISIDDRQNRVPPPKKLSPRGRRCAVAPLGFDATTTPRCRADIVDQP